MKPRRKLWVAGVLTALATTIVVPVSVAAPLSGGELSTSVSQSVQNSGEIAAWFANSALSVARSNATDALPDLTSDQLANLVVGTPLNVVAFAKNDPKTYDDATVWIAPLLVDDGYVGTVATNYHDDAPHDSVVTSSVRLAEAVSDTPENARVVLEPQFASNDTLGAWFLVDASDMVTPLDPVASSLLAGPVTLAQYQQIREELLSDSSSTRGDTTETQKSAENDGGVVRTAILVLAVLLAVVGVIVWLRHELDEGEDRAGNAVAKGEEHHNDHGRRIFQRGADQVHIYEVPPDKAGRSTGILPAIAAPLGGTGDSETAAERGSGDPTGDGTLSEHAETAAIEETKTDEHTDH